LFVTSIKENHERSKLPEMWVEQHQAFAEDDARRLGGESPASDAFSVPHLPKSFLQVYGEERKLHPRAKKIRRAFAVSR
jgi:hypothetical protein